MVDSGSYFPEFKISKVEKSEYVLWKPVVQRNKTVELFLEFEIMQI